MLFVVLVSVWQSEGEGAWDLGYAPERLVYLALTYSTYLGWCCPK